MKIDVTAIQGRLLEWREACGAWREAQRLAFVERTAACFVRQHNRCDNVGCECMCHDDVFVADCELQLDLADDD